MSINLQYSILSVNKLNYLSIYYIHLSKRTCLSAVSICQPFVYLQIQLSHSINFLSYRSVCTICQFTLSVHLSLSIYILSISFHLLISPYILLALSFPSKNLSPSTYLSAPSSLPLSTPFSLGTYASATSHPVTFAKR